MCRAESPRASAASLALCVATPASHTPPAAAAVSEHQPSANRRFRNLWYVLHVAEFRRAPVQVSGIGKAIRSCSVGALRRDSRLPHAPRRCRCFGPIRVQGSGFRVQGAGCRVQGAGFRVQGSGCRVQGAGCRVQGSQTFATHSRGSPLLDLLDGCEYCEARLVRVADPQHDLI